MLLKCSFLFHIKKYNLNELVKVIKIVLTLGLAKSNKWPIENEKLLCCALHLVFCDGL